MHPKSILDEFRIVYFLNREKFKVVLIVYRQKAITEKRLKGINMKKISSAVLLFALVLIPQVSFAKNAWTQCGIGAAIFPSTGWAAAISNVWWDLGTTATSSSSSTESQCAGRGDTMGVLIYQNYANVEEETAIGQGEHLNAMMTILGCDSSIQSEFIQDVRTDLLNDVKDASYLKKSKLEKTEALYNNVINKAGKKYAQFCSVG